MIFVFPSLKRIIYPYFMNSGRYLNENLTIALSSFRRICSPIIYSSTTVCWIVPQWSTPSYFAFIVVELCKTCISASKPITGSGFSWASITTIPRRISVLTSFSLALLALREKQTSSPAKAYVRATLFTWIDFIVTPLKFLNLSGPKTHALFNVATPAFMIPDTTKPTPSTWKH